MRKLSMTVMLCGVLVSACDGEGGESPAHEQPGGTGPESSIASSSQAVVSQSLTTSLACVETYVNAGTCDWPHWNELWETCKTYEHVVLEDGRFLEAVQAGGCRVDTWPALREQLLAVHPQRVLVRESCDGDSLVIQEAEANGCYTLDPSVGASYIDVPIGKSVTLHAGANCSGDSVTVRNNANLCSTSFESGASADDNVRSLRVQDVQAPPSPYRYVCTSAEPMCVRNYNSRLNALNQTQTVRIARVTRAGTTTPTMAAIQRKITELDAFFAVASRNQLRLDLIRSQNVEVTSSDCEAAKGQAVKQFGTTSFLTVYVMPTGMCSVSRGSASKIYLNDNLLRTHAHETGHILGLAHGNVRDPATGKVTQYGDASTFMGKYSSDNYNLPQLHWLGWTKKEELVLINPAIDSVGSIEVTLRPFGNNADSTSPLPLGAVWDIPDSESRLFFAVPKPRLNETNDIGGGAVFVHRAPKCDGCVSIDMGTLQVARFGPRATAEYSANGLRFKPVGFTSRFVQVNGKSVEEFTSVTLRIWR
ncbi:hypothetical protein ACN469_27030 [Corallococcus terminator]